MLSLSRIIPVALALAGVSALGVAGYVRLTRETPPPEACIAEASQPLAPDRGMVRISGGRFRMGSEEFRPEERPVREAEVAAFWIDAHHVTNAQFARFVAETGYRTVAERKNPRTGTTYGSLVFSQPKILRDMQDLSQWWRVAVSANWRHPEGQGSSIARRANHPVVHVTYEDAAAYARWAGRSLPTEEQWEFAARGGRDGAAYVWGDEADSDAAPRANRWRGQFPYENLGSRGFRGTSPVGCFPPNGYGLYDMAGNVWHWTQTIWREDHRKASLQAPDDAAERVIKGGSFLCAPNYCLRYRPAARQPGEPGSSTSHIGFRTVLNGEK